MHSSRIRTFRCSGNLVGVSARGRVVMSAWEGVCLGGVCLGGICPGMSAQGGGVCLGRGVSDQGGV